MCGIAGIFSYSKQLDNDKIGKIRNGYYETLKNRGPNNQSEYISDKIFFYHTRLSIIDLSVNGNQPMISNNNRFILIFNGEIYNHIDIYNDIKNKYNFKGKSDTEVFLALITLYGVKKAIQISSGMFAFAIYDNFDKKLTIGTDPMGKKPIYWSNINGQVHFCSTLRGVIEGVDQKFKINKKSVNSFINYSYIPSPHTILENVFKIEAGTIIEYDIEGNVTKNKYYDIYEKARYGTENLEQDYETIKERLKYLIYESVSKRMISDVPLGCFLSGGIDSSLIATIMSDISQDKINTFTIGFKDYKYNETEDSKNLASFLKTNHHEYFPTKNDLLDVANDLNNIFDEPFGDLSQFPTAVLCKLVSRKATVALSGDGGDELFGGYNRYLIANTYWKYLNLFPSKLRKYLLYYFKTIGLENLEKYLKVFGFPIFQLSNLNIYKVKRFLLSESLIDFHDKMISNYNEEDKFEFYKLKSSNFGNSINSMLLHDQINYLKDDILTKVDRSSMYSSLEVRNPLLDKKLLEYSWRIPINKKIYGSKGKIILRNMLKEFLPKKIISKQKSGFGIPFREFLTVDLKDWVFKNIEFSKSSSLQQFSYLQLERSWNSYCSNKNSNTLSIWTKLVFYNWIEHYEKKIEW